VNRINHLEETLLDRRRPLSPRNDERERITRARRAAEALFTSNRQLIKQSVPDSLPSVDQSARKPRVLKALSPATAGHEESRAPVDSEPQVRPAIPKSQFARIRIWVEYGMTAAQVAAVYGVAVDVIEAILRKT
jgi:hypothetical protein